MRNKPTCVSFSVEPVLIDWLVGLMGVVHDMRVCVFCAFFVIFAILFTFCSPMSVLPLGFLSLPLSNTHLPICCSLFLPLLLSLSVSPCVCIYDKMYVMCVHVLVPRGAFGLPGSIFLCTVGLENYLFVLDQLALCHWKVASAISLHV